MTVSCQSQKNESTNDPVNINEAIDSSNRWLSLVDSNDFGKSWENASELFRNSVSKDDWIKALEGIRTPLGRIIKRDIDSKEYRTSLPGAPEGEYVVITYKTEFENKGNSIETVTPMKDKDGKWRVSGYFIR